MSADLFAEFGKFSQPSGANNRQSQPHNTTNTAAVTTPFPPSDPFAFLGSASQPSAAPQPASQWQLSQTSNTSFGGPSWGGVQSGSEKASQGTGDDDDAWGDFEVASPDQEVFAPNIAPQPQKTIAQHPAAQPAQGPLPRNRIVRASTLDLMTNSLVDIPGGAPAPPGPAQTKSFGRQAMQKPPPLKPKNTDPNVLFDAENFDPDEATSDTDDDFGDFEGVTSLPPKAPAQSTPVPSGSAFADLLGLDDTGPVSSRPAMASGTRKEPPSQLMSSLSLQNQNANSQHPKSPSFQERNPFPGLELVTPKASEFPKHNIAQSPSPVTAWPTLEKNDPPPVNDAASMDGWASFQDTSAERPVVKADEASLGWDWDAIDSKPAQRAQPKLARQKETTKAVEEDSSWDWEAFDSPSAAAQPGQERKQQQQNPAPSPPSIADSAPPPTNIPPPSILLSLFSSLLDLPNTSLFKPTAAQGPSSRERVLADAKTAEFLRGYLALATVAARVLAGRKLRWHRDKFLAQGMAVSAAGGRGGMKLAGLDRSQAAREEREAADVAAVWKAGVGRLRSAVAGANAALSNSSNSGRSNGQLRVPELAETMVVQTAKVPVPTAPRACVVCGLKRDERVKGVDFEVEDSFGEWWVEFWGHRACKNFWVEHEGKLRSR